MKRISKFMSTTVSVVCLSMLFTGAAHSGPRKVEKPLKQVMKSRQIIHRAKLPDLIVQNIKLIKDCKIKVTIKNVGTAGVPDSGYDMQKGASIQMYKGSQPWGGIRLGAVDTAKKLKQPGGTASYIWFPGAANLDLGAGMHSIKLIVDNNNAVIESKETNNTLTRRLGCKPSQPDLIVQDIKLIKDCKIKVTIKNIGTAGVPDSGYNMQNGASIQMYKGSKPWGGIRLGAVDTAKKLKQPGATVSYIWFPGAANLDLGAGTHSIKLVVDNNNAVIESNETNNTLTKRLGCKPEQPKKPDLIVSNIKLTSNCMISYTIKNIGTAGVPASAYNNTNKQFLQFYDGTKFMGGISLKASDPYNHLQSPGGSEFGTANPGNYTPEGPHSIKIVVDTINIVDETNENNNNRILNQTCTP